MHLSETNNLAQLVAERTDWHVMLLQYGATHSLLHLALHVGDYPRHIGILCTGCVRIEAATQGGPYQLEVRRLADDMVQLRAVDGSFCVECVSLERVDGCQ